MVYEADLAGTLIEILAAGGRHAADRRRDRAGRGRGRSRRRAAAAGRRRGPDPLEPRAPTQPAASSCGSPRRAPGRAAGPAPPARQPQPSWRRRAGQGLPIAKRIARDEGSICRRWPGPGPAGGSSRRTWSRHSPRASPLPPPQPGRGAGPRCRPCRADPGRRREAETAKGQVEVVELTKLQQTVARRMAESKATAPHFYLQAEIDMSAAVDGRAQLKARREGGRARPDLQRHGRQGVRARAARVPARQRRLPRRHASSSTRGSTSGSRSPPRTRWSSRPSSTPTSRGCGRSPPRRGRWPRGSATGRSLRPSSRAAPSPSPTSACTGSPTSTR